MQSAFCTNCGLPLAPGAAFCASCGTRVEASGGASSAPNAYQSGAPNNTPAYNSPAAFTPPASPPPAPPAKTPKSRFKVLAGWIGGCLAATLVVVALLIGSLIYGITSHHLTFFFIGLIGLVLIFLVAAAVEHIIRRLIRRAAGGIENLERDVLGGPGTGPRRYEGRARPYRNQPQFSPIRFIFTLVILAALLYGGLFLYYSQAFAGAWSGTLKIGNAAQGVLVAQFPVRLSLHLSNWPNITEVDFQQTAARACKGSQSYTLSGTATMLDASKATMTLTSGNAPNASSITLTGTYQSGAFTLSGTSGGKPVILTLQKGSEQQGYVAACG